jgi:hypothetical protein
MPDLGAVIASMGDSGARVATAKVVAPGVGVASVEINGGTFLDVPFMRADYGGGQAYPSIGQTVYVIAQEGWGMAILGAPATGPARGGLTGTVLTWDPAVLARHYSSNVWTVNSDNEVDLSYDQEQVMIWSVTNRPTLPGSSLSGVAVYLNVLSAENPFVGGGAYMTMGLHNSPAPSGPLIPVAGTSEITLNLEVGDPVFYPLPLDWGNRLIASTAKGIYLKTESDYMFVTIELGQLQLSFL